MTTLGQLTPLAHSTPDETTPGPLPGRGAPWAMRCSRVRAVVRHADSHTPIRACSGAVAGRPASPAAVPADRTPAHRRRLLPRLLPRPGCSAGPGLHALARAPRWGGEGVVGEPLADAQRRGQATRHAGAGLATRSRPPPCLVHARALPAHLSLAGGAPLTDMATSLESCGAADAVLVIKWTR